MSYVLLPLRDVIKKTFLNFIIIFIYLFIYFLIMSSPANSMHLGHTEWTLLFIALLGSTLFWLGIALLPLLSYVYVEQHLM